MEDNTIKWLLDEYVNQKGLCRDRFVSYCIGAIKVDVEKSTGISYPCSDVLELLKLIRDNMS